jgi:hypothetical protein
MGTKGILKKVFRGELHPCGHVLTPQIVYPETKEEIMKSINNMTAFAQNNPHTDIN